MVLRVKKYYHINYNMPKNPKGWIFPPAVNVQNFCLSQDCNEDSREVLYDLWPCFRIKETEIYRFWRQAKIDIKNDKNGSRGNQLFSLHKGLANFPHRITTPSWLPQLRLHRNCSGKNENETTQKQRAGEKGVNSVASFC